MNRLFYIFVCLIICLITFNTDSVFAQKKKTSSSKKKSKSSSGAKNAYQDLTTRYNRYFNAKMRYTEGIKQLEISHKDDYSELLPVYAYDKGDGTSIGGNLNEVITKTQEAIKLKPNSKWIDDCYLLMGKAYYLQGDNTSADQAFQYINGKFKNRLRISATVDKSQLAKERKEREKEREKERLKEKKERDKERAEQEKAREAEKKEKVKAKKEREKERAADKKAKEKAKKAREKERAKEKKRKAREKKKRMKAKAKAKRQRAKGKTPKKTSSSKSSSSSKKTSSDTKKTDKTSDKKDEDTKKSTKADEIEEQERLENEKLEKEAEEQAAAEEEEVEEEVAEIKEKSYKKGGLSHQPVSHEATVWLARSYISQEQFGDAESLLRKAQSDKSFPKRVSGQLNTLEAHYYLQRQDWDKAKTALQAAIKTTRKKKDKARLYYILAQLEQRDNNFAGALENFEKVLKKRPTYEMEFNAKLNIAKTKMQSGEFNAERAITYLKKMLRDSKNDEFQDQIYFTMAEIELENGNEDKATEYFADAAKNSTVNPEQKAKAFLRLADLSYERENYVMASSYYDSTLVVLPKDHERYEEISDRRIVLTDLVKHIQIVELQDSLRRIADMSDAARLAYLEDVIAQLEKEAQAEADAQQAFLEEQNKKQDKKAGGTFYFYNDAAKAVGRNDFLGRWGQRSNTDNWRLSSKSSGLGSLASTDTTSVSRNTLMALAGKGKLTVEDLMKDLPLTKAAKAQSDSLVTASLYAIGRIYHVRLKANDKAIVSFDELLNRFPKTEHSAAAHYNLYLLHKNEGQNAKAKKSKNVILNDYPESKYAKLLQDADYLKVLAQKERELEEYYEKTYAYFKSENFSEVGKRQKQVNDLFPENPLQPKFDLLGAMVVGHTGDKIAYMKALEDVIKKHPEDEVKDKAEEILKYLRKGGKKSNKSNKKGAKYQYKPNSRHYFVVAFEGFSQKINTATNGLSDFNMGNFKTDKLKVNPMLLDPKNQIVLVKDFKNAEKAKIYFKTLKEQESDIFKGLDVPFKTFIISKSNFSQYFKDKKADVYYEFFLENYQ